MKYYYFKHDGTESSFPDSEVGIVRKHQSGLLPDETQIRESKWDPWESILKLPGVSPSYLSENKPARFYYAVNSFISQEPEEVGELIKMHQAGILPPVTLVRANETDQWASIFTLPGASPVPFSVPDRRDSPAEQPPALPSVKESEPSKHDYFSPSLKKWNSIRRAIWITGGLGIVSNGLFLLAGIIVLISADPGMRGVAVIYLLMGCFGLPISIGWFRGKRWAWATVTVLNTLGMLCTSFSSPSISPVVGIAVGVPIMILIGVLFYPGFNPMPKEDA